MRQLRQDCPNIFIVVIPPNISPGIYDHNSLVAPLLGQLKALGYISIETQDNLSSIIVRDGTFSHSITNTFASIFDLSKKILSAVIFLQEITHSEGNDTIEPFIVMNSGANHPIPDSFYDKWIKQGYLVSYSD